MKKLLMVCAIVLMFGVGTALAQAPTYQFAEAGTKNFVSEITSAAGTQISLDLYLSNVPEPQNAGGAFIDFEGSTANISYVSAGRALEDGSEGITGPWTPGTGALVRPSDGTVAYICAQLGGAPPDAAGDLIVGTLTLQVNTTEASTVVLSVSDQVTFWTPIDDSTVVAATLDINPGPGCECSIDADCDDGIVCTDDTCDGCNCVYTPNDSNCDDGMFCNGTETCDAASDCQAGTAPDCDDGIDCTDDICDTGLDACVNTPDDALCDDGAFCNGAETCDAASDCQPGTPPVCDDGVGCTDDVCDEAIDDCVSTENDANCPDDGLYCNGDEFCDAVNDCSSTGNPCPPELPVCTEDGGGTCTAECECSIDADCDDGIGCTDDTCDGCACVYSPNDSNCDDGAFCNGAETCDAASDCQAGTPPVCDDGVGCTDDVCDEGIDDCVSTPNDANCPDDGMFCNGEEFCDAVNDCQSTGNPCPPGETCNEETDTCETGCECSIDADCDDGIGCTDDTCDGCACVYSPNDSNCDDGAFCNGAETCDAASDCQAGTPPDCDDGVGCTDDVCDEAIDACASTPNDANCPDDGVFCNGTEFCDEVNDCQSTGNPCPPGETCDEASDSCVSGCECETDDQCEDGIACTDDTCDGCACVYSPNDSNCDDGMFCNGAESCDPVNDCQAGTPVDCNDGVGCTDDICDEAIDACVSNPNDANCPDDGVFCNGDEFCDPVNDCSSTGDPCVPPEVCDEENDICEPGGEEQIVSFDLKPGSCPNAFNVKSNGVLSAAILGTDEFDVTTIDPDSIRLTREGIGSEVLPRMDKPSYHDAGTPFEGEPCDCHKRKGDGYMDLSLKFTSQDVANGLDLKGIPQWQIMIPLTIVGETYDGTPIKGEDCLMIIDPPKNK